MYNFIFLYICVAAHTDAYMYSYVHIHICIKYAHLYYMNEMYVSRVQNQASNRLFSCVALASPLFGLLGSVSEAFRLSCFCPKDLSDVNKGPF